MNTINFVSDEDLAAVSGGRIAFLRPDFKDQRGVPGSGGGSDLLGAIKDIATIAGAVAGIVGAITGSTGQT